MKFLSIILFSSLFLIFKVNASQPSSQNSLIEVNKLLKSGQVIDAEKKLVNLVLNKDIKAIRFYAVCLIQGKYFKKNITRALAVLNEGAKNNDGLSALTLGNFFSDGKYFKPKYKKAKYYYEIALKNGQKKAAKRITYINSKIGEEISEEKKINENDTKEINNNENKKENNNNNENPKIAELESELDELKKIIRGEKLNEEVKFKAFKGFSNQNVNWAEDYPNYNKVKAFGSSFAISNYGDFITNEHVIDDCKRVFIKYQNKIKQGKIRFKSKSRDIALVQIKSKTPSYFGFKQKKISLGEKIISGGFPAPDQLSDDIKITDGIVSSISKKIDFTSGNSIVLFQHTTPTQPGNSGGPLINIKGQLVGMTTSRQDDKKFREQNRGLNPQNINFAVPAKEIIKLLKDNKISYDVNNINNIYDTEFLATILKKTAGQVICSD